MSAETTGKFVNDLRGRIDYFRTEFHLTYAEAIGCLDILKHELLEEVLEEEKDE